jgi:hypothetical protein
MAGSRWNPIPAQYARGQDNEDRLAMRIAVVVLMGISLAAQAHAEVIISDRDRDNYCRFYADQAVKDNEDNVKLGCGYKGPEWQSVFGAHYGWCMRLRADVLANATDAQKTNRGAAITICYCHHYAREAVKSCEGECFSWVWVYRRPLGGPSCFPLQLVPISSAAQPCSLRRRAGTHPGLTGLPPE